MVLRAIVT